ncbi:Peptidase, M50 family [uncultured Eubacteriales bacterium]|uniref:Peptidase, M50 family n=1 Tax=uncultured Eubacteriales bacterium TaxID=172733 RepID=A0A212JZH6_9FIRM|nr:Peptidase, M50 family [uncultured Eubacteriales bacterium]
MNTFLEYFQQMNWDKLVSFLLQAAAVLICLTLHELGHGMAAYMLGDPTAKKSRRLSLNPLRHLDPFGALMMLLFGFGWAKPVPIDIRYFKHPKQGLALTALAGPATNFLLAYVALVGANFFLPLAYAGAAWAEYLVNFLATLCLSSLGLGIFNLIPFPPLDGSKVVEGFLPDKITYTILRYERYGMLGLMLVLWLGWLDGPLVAARSAVLNLFQNGAAWAAVLGARLI